MFKYVITGQNYKALPVKSDLNFIEFSNYVRNSSQLKNPGNPLSDVVFRWGILELVNPCVHTLESFGDCSALIGIK